MRFLFCKIHCPSFICFCKPSPHIYTPGPLKLENTPHVPSKLVSVPEASDQLPGETIEVKEESLDGKQPPAENCMKSSLRKPNLGSGAVEENQKKKVQWMDFLGKELVELREFESSEIEYTDNEDSLCSTLTMEENVMINKIEDLRARIRIYIWVIRFQPW